jgi:2-oxo-4-hydroxy-4-carboxy-5-ureidoimidazoline decarboxylase
MSGITSRKCSIAELNASSAADFVATVGGIFEHSPWIAVAAASQRPFLSRDALHTAMVAIVQAAGSEKQLALINAHPDLAGRLAQQGQLTAESTLEQSAAGLSQADASVIERIQSLNTAYRSRFGFPFIICARLNNVATILTAMEQRVHHSPDEEIATALGEISKIAQLRLADIVED